MQGVKITLYKRHTKKEPFKEARKVLHQIGKRKAKSRPTGTINKIKKVEQYRQHTFK